MKFRMVHNNFNVLDLERSLKFYADAFDMKEVRRINAKDGSFIIVYLEDGSSSHQLELTWLRDRKEPYDLGDDEFHLAFRVDDFDAAHARHEKMGCICYENPAMGIYFVTDPEGSQVIRITYPLAARPALSTSAFAPPHIDFLPLSDLFSPT